MTITSVATLCEASRRPSLVGRAETAGAGPGDWPYRADTGREL